MSVSQEIAKTIISQIKATDFWSLARWAAREYVSLPEGNSDKDAGSVQGGVCFKVSGTKNVRSRGYVYVFLTWNDTYTVKVIKASGSTIKLVKLVEDVYCDTLNDVIDDILDGDHE